MDKILPFPISNKKQFEQRLRSNIEKGLPAILGDDYSVELRKYVLNAAVPPAVEIMGTLLKELKTMGRGRALYRFVFGMATEVVKARIEHFWCREDLRELKKMLKKMLEDPNGNVKIVVTKDE